MSTPYLPLSDRYGNVRVSICRKGVRIANQSMYGPQVTPTVIQFHTSCFSTNPTCISPYIAARKCGSMEVSCRSGRTIEAVTMWAFPVQLASSPGSRTSPSAVLRCGEGGLEICWLVRLVGWLAAGYPRERRHAPLFSSAYLHTVTSKR